MPVMDVREWIYSLTKDETIGAKAKSGQQHPSNRNFTRTLTESVTVMLGEVPVELPIGTQLAVYRQLTRSNSGDGWGYQSDAVLAAIFLKGTGGNTVEQFSVRMNGRIVRRKL